LPPRLVAGLLYLQHANDASDEAVVATWLENPYWQYFCGETYLQTKLPMDPSSLTRWRKRIKGALGDTLHAVLCGAGHNIRLLINKLKSNGITGLANA
jgi:IS5 family transposase